MVQQHVTVCSPFPPFRLLLLFLRFAPQLASLTLAELSIILLPIDAANNSGNVQCDEAWSGMFCGALDMAAAWHTVFLLIFIFALFIVPYTIFFYEEDDSLALT